MREVHLEFVDKPEGKRPIERPRRRWDDNVRIDIADVELVARIEQV